MIAPRSAGEHLLRVGVRARVKVRVRVGVGVGARVRSVGEHLSRSSERAVALATW